MKSLASLLLLTAFFSFGCDGSGSGGSNDGGDSSSGGRSGTGNGSGGGGGSSGGPVAGELTGVVWTEGGYVGWPLDSDPPEPILAEGRFEGGDTFAADATGVWIGFRDGEMYGFNPDGTRLRGPIDVAADGIGPDHIGDGRW